MRLLRKLLTFILAIVGVIAIIGVGGYVFVRVKYDIDLFNTVGQLKTINEKVDEKVMCPHSFTSDDMADVKTIVNGSVEGMITYDETNGYYVNLENLANMNTLIKLSDKQVGALAEKVIEEETQGKVNVGDNTFTYELKQIQFSNVENGGCDFNTVVKLDFTDYKSTLVNFPFNLIKKYVPDSFYVSSTVTVEKKTEAFSYEVSHKELRINNLTKEQTDDMFHTLDVIFKMGTSDSFNQLIGKTVVDTLIGNESQKGFAYSLKSHGATDFHFETNNEINYFVIER